MEKNRMRKNAWLTPVLSATLLLTAAISPEVMAQFDKYKSKTRFNKATPPAKSSSLPISPPQDFSDTGKSAKSLLQDTSNFSQGDEGDGEEMSNNNDSSEGNDSAAESGSSGRDTFGRAGNKDVKPNKIDKKYVNLNPETAFGPEVVTSFDFPNVSILDLTKHMQKLTGLNLILDKDIKGKISISSPTPITIGDAWKAYLQALSINGYSLVKTGAYYTIVNNRDIRYSPTTMYTGTYTYTDLCHATPCSRDH